MDLDPTRFDEDYYRHNGQLGDRPALRYYVRLMARYVGRGRVLDFGCGTGHLLRRMSALGQADGFEVSEYSADRARKTAPGAEVFTVAADIPTAAYQGLASIHVVEHLDDTTLAAAFATWRRVLVPGGKALVVTPDLAGFGRALTQDRWNGFSDPTHINLKAHSDWKLMLEDNGFTVLREGSDGLWDVPYGRLPRLADAALHAIPAFTQYVSGRLILRPGTGESSIFVVSTRG